MDWFEPLDKSFPSLKDENRMRDKLDLLRKLQAMQEEEEGADASTEFLRAADDEKSPPPSPAPRRHRRAPSKRLPRQWRLVTLNDLPKSTIWDDLGLGLPTADDLKQRPQGFESAGRRLSDGEVVYNERTAWFSVSWLDCLLAACLVLCLGLVLRKCLSSFRSPPPSTASRPQTPMDASQYANFLRLYDDVQELRKQQESILQKLERVYYMPVALDGTITKVVSS